MMVLEDMMGARGGWASDGGYTSLWDCSLWDGSQAVPLKIWHFTECKSHFNKNSSKEMAHDFPPKGNE